MKKVIETDNNNSKNLEIKGTNNYSCQGKKRQVTWKKHVFLLKYFIYGQIGIYINYIVKSVINSMPSPLTVASKRWVIETWSYFSLK